MWWCGLCVTSSHLISREQNECQSQLLHRQKAPMVLLNNPARVECTPSTPKIHHSQVQVQVQRRQGWWWNWGTLLMRQAGHACPSRDRKEMEGWGRSVKDDEQTAAPGSGGHGPNMADRPQIRGDPPSLWSRANKKERKEPVISKSPVSPVHCPTTRQEMFQNKGRNI